MIDSKTVPAASGTSGKATYWISSPRTATPTGARPTAAGPVIPHDMTDHNAVRATHKQHPEWTVGTLAVHFGIPIGDIRRILASRTTKPKNVHNEHTKNDHR